VQVRHPAILGHSRNVGNLSSATILLFSREWLEKRPLKAGEYALAAAFWPGLQRGISCYCNGPERLFVSRFAFLPLDCYVWSSCEISKRHQKEMAARGARKSTSQSSDGWSCLHTAVLLGAALEVVFLRRPFILWLAAPMFAIFLAANAVRWWVIRSLGEHWNVQVVDSTRLGVVTSGPFRYVRHPKLCGGIRGDAGPSADSQQRGSPQRRSHRAYRSSGAAAFHEERVLFANPDYRAAMTGKPRFLPGLF